MFLDFQSQLQRFLGLDERELLYPMGKLIARSRTLVDVGANDGYYTLAFLKSRADAILACEPGLVMADLVANANANGYSIGGRFETVQTAIGNSEGCISLAEILRDKPEPIFIKVDVDGSELDVLQSSEECCNRMDLAWIVEIHSHQLERDCQNWLQKRGYVTEIIDHAWWRRFIPELRPRELNRWILATSPTTG